MVYFKDITIVGVPHLAISDDDKQRTEKATRLKTHTSLIDGHAAGWPKFINPIHKGGWSHLHELPKASVWVLQSAHHQSIGDTSILPSLGRRIVDEKLSWGDDIEFTGEAHYIKGYWEWTEDILSRFRDVLRELGIYDSVYASLFTYDRNTDIIKAFCEAWCPSTNTLLTSVGELSISLWDLHVLSGLPTDGTLYDEMVPRADELIGDRRGKLHLPASCKHLFHAYHFLRGKGDNSNSTVSVEDWIKFWARKVVRYTPPPPRKEKKSAPRKENKSTSNPTGEFQRHVASWTPAERIPFSTLEVREKHWDETHLAAYLACWLCTFVLPEGDVSLIRPSTFKVASMMASRTKVALTVPVLASIYKGLNTISKLAELSRVQVAFPIHFVYAWLAQYFKTHYPLARKSHIPKMIQFAGEGHARYYNPMDARRRIISGIKSHGTA